MILDHFSMSKNPKMPDKIEDGFVVVPDYCYAVIDGVSDKTGLRFGNKTSGQMATHIIACVINKLPELVGDELIGADRLLSLIDAEFNRVAEELKTDTLGAAQLVLVQERADNFQFIIIGDAGLRINGTEIFRTNHVIDEICAYGRRAIWLYLEEHAVPVTQRNDIARGYTVNGMDTVLELGTKWIVDATLTVLLQQATNDISTVMPNISEQLISQTLRSGLLIQPRYVNRIHDLGYPSINGSAIPRELVVQFDRKRDAINTIELFSDGYFSCPRGTTVQDWEDEFQKTEATDPNKIGQHLSTKGSGDKVFSDDRTVVVLNIS